MSKVREAGRGSDVTLLTSEILSFNRGKMRNTIGCCS
jgi:hypothetical protein